MLQAPNLLDLFANARKEAQAKAAQAKPAADASGRNNGRNGSTDLLPIDTDAKTGKTANGANGANGKGAASTLSTFASKVQESHAKLAARIPKPASHLNKAPEAIADKSAAKTVDASQSQSARTNRPESPRPLARKAQKPRDNDAASASAQKNDTNRPDPAATEMVRDDKPQAGKGSSKGGNADEQSVSTGDLKKNLEANGIYASDEQLNDPRMLADIMAMLKDMLQQQGLNFDAAQTAPTAATGDAPQIPAVQDGAADAPAVAGQDGTQTAQGTDGTKAGQKDVFDLIKDRIADLTKNPGAEQTRIVRPDATPVTTPAEWQGIKVRPQTESVGTAPLPTADLDRLRVMQSSAMQTASAKPSDISSVELPGDDGSAEAIPEAGLSQVSHAEKESAPHSDQHSQADLFGRNGDTAGNAEASASKEGPLVAKDGAIGPQFHASLEQARTVDHRAGIERAWEPRPAYDAGVLDQIAKKMSAVGHKNGDEISIQLTPEHLGKVRVSLEMRDGSMAARISVESEDVKKQVEAGLSSLRDSLENQGIKLQGLEVSVDQRRSSLFNPDGSNSESFFQRNGRGAQAGVNGTPEAAPFETAPESDTGRRMGYNTMEYIG